jgi:DNA-binding NarL/FixJ family response regulator
MKLPIAPKSINVIIADDSHVFRKGLREIIKSIPYIKRTDEAVNGNDLMDMLQQRNYDLALLDIRMPGMDGIEASNHIRKKYPGIRIIFISMNDDYFSIKETYDAGCHGYLLKNADEIEIVKAIDTVLNGGKYFSVEVMGKLLPSANVDSKINRLSAADIRLIELIYEEKTNNEIALEFNLALRSVENRRNALYRTIGVNNTAGLIRFAIQNGIIKL